MLRTFAFALIIVAGVLPVIASAQTVLPADINIHNGLIEVRNEVVLKNVPSARGNLQLKWEGGLVMENLYSIPEKTAFFNTCCIAAGSRYVVKYELGPEIRFVEVRPQLCNIRGIPFGYALIVVTGQVVYEKVGTPIAFKVQAHEEPAKCPI